MAVINRMSNGPTKPERNLVTERDDITDMVYDLVQRLLPDDGSGMPDNVERSVESIRRHIGIALGIDN